MKNIIFRLLALILVLSMVFTALVGCIKKDDTNTGSGGTNNGVTNNDTTDTGNEDNGEPDTDGTDTEETDAIVTTIYEIAKYGNLILYMYGSELFDKGYEHGDVLEIAIGEQKWDVPLCTNYSDVDNGEVVLRATTATDGVVLAINMGDFATTAGIAEKSKIDEDPGYRWDYLMESSVEIKITLKEKGGYRDQWLIRQLTRTNDRADYAHLSDEEFANFRAINTTGMGFGVLYRSSSPINPDLGRNTYADKAAENAGIMTIVNLADLSNTYESAESSYYSTAQVTYVNLGMDFLGAATLSGIAEGMRFIINNNGPYLIHCNEGKDRAGFVSALLECLMGATIDEVIEDYMVTYYNYYGVEKGTEKYNAVVNSNIVKSLGECFKVNDIYSADLVAEAEAYLIEEAGLTADEVAALKGKLCISLQEVYEAGKDYNSLLGDHESVFIHVTSGGNVIWEEYFSNQYCYSYYSSEYLDIGFEYSSFSNGKDQYYCIDDVYTLGISIAPSGMVDISDIFSLAGSSSFIADAMLNDAATIIQKDGFIIVSCTADLDEIYTDENVVSCVETYTIDAKTREMVAVKTTYTFDDGSIDEGVVTITRDGEIPEGMKPYVEYTQQTEDLRTITIVSNPGADNEKTESVQVVKGLLVEISPDYLIEEPFTLYADADCTQVFEDSDLNADVTVYVKWGE